MNRQIFLASHPTSRSWLNVTFVLCLALSSSSCVVSPAPAYRILKESRGVQFVSGQIPELRVRAGYTLENYGNSDLASIDVILPNKEVYGLKALLIKINGREASPAELSAESEAEEATKFRVPLDPAWNQKQRRDLVIEYILSSPKDLGTNINLRPTSFHVVSRDWFPSLQPPTHVLSPSPGGPERTNYTVQVPSDFLLLAPGKAAGRTQDGAEVKYRFELRKNDPAPFIVAGRYVDSCLDRRPCAAAFWTLEPIKKDLAPAEEQIASAWDILQKNFGPLQKSDLVPHIVESPGMRRIDYDVPAAAAFAGGVLVNSQAISLGVYSGDFLDLVTRALAGNWFGVQIYSPDSAVGMTEGLSDYAVIVIDQSRHGDSARSERVLRFLLEYDDACKEAVEKPLISTTLQDTVEQRRIALAKAPLFFIALEDAYGEEPVRRGLAEVLTLLRGQAVGYPDIRAALGTATKKDLAPMFRVWIYKTGIPDEFRQKYEGRERRK